MRNEDNSNHSARNFLESGNYGGEIKKDRLATAFYSQRYILYCMPYGAFVTILLIKVT